jgi:quercetin dioxygenase-like cupin family protein
MHSKSLQLLIATCVAGACSGDAADIPLPESSADAPSAFGPESGVVTAAEEVPDLRAARLRPLDPMTGDVEILYGHPDSAGQPFVIRIRELPGTIVPPHRHPVDEHITVVQGTWYFGLGEQFDSTALQKLGVGSYAFAPAGATMFAYSPELAVVQVHGIGPFHIQWRNAGHVLDEPGADAAFRYRRNQAVVTPRGTGRIRQGYRSGQIIQYEVLTDAGVHFMVSESELRPVSTP